MRLELTELKIEQRFIKFIKNVVLIFLIYSLASLLVMISEKIPEVKAYLI